MSTNENQVSALKRRAFKEVLTAFPRKQYERLRTHGYVTKAGVVYDEELAGRGGMSFTLIKDRRTTPDMLVASVKELRAQRDVVGLIKVAEVV